MPAGPFKLTVFISSRNLNPIVINKVAGESLTDVRLFLQEHLQDELFLGEKFLNVEINETFAMDATIDSYNICMKRAAEADLVIALYNGESGWGPDGNNTGICHAELDAAFQASAKKVYIIDITDFSGPPKATGADGVRNVAFKKYIFKQNRFNNPLKPRRSEFNPDGFKAALLRSVKNIISRHMNERVAMSNMYYAISGSSAVSKDWMQLNYKPLTSKMKNKLEEVLEKDILFEDTLKVAHAIPNKMSDADARSYTGRPFLTDQITITSKGVPASAIGPIHFIAVFSSATESQVKSMIGHPDISVIKDDFGFYLWDQHMHIQLVFLTECGTPTAISTKYILFQNWATANDEVSNIINRAKARSLILRSINQAESVAAGRK